MIVAARFLLALALDEPRGYAGPTAVVAPEPAAAADASPQVPRPHVVPRPDLRPDAAPEPSASRRVPSRRLGRVEVRWAVDAGITAAAAVPAVVLSRWVTPQLPQQPLPATAPQIGRADAVALGRFDPRASLASDALLSITMAAGPLVSLVDGYWAAQRGARPGRAFAHRWATVMLVQGEAIALTGVVTGALKHAVGRPRPYTSLAAADVDPGDRRALAEWMDASDRALSFPSGHTSLAFAAATSLATVLSLDAPRTRRARVVIALAWSLGLAAAGTTAALRVVAGKHYPSDVVAGAAIGSAIGTVTPLLHARRRRF